FREVRTRFARCDAALISEAKQRFGVETPFGGATSSGMLTLHCPPKHVHELATLLRERGAETIAVADLGYVFSSADSLYAKLEAGLERARGLGRGKILSPLCLPACWSGTPSPSRRGGGAHGPAGRGRRARGSLCPRET